MIELRDLAVRFDGTDAVRGVTLDVAADEWVMLIGPNGAGKTSILRALCGLLPFEGGARLEGRDVRSLGRRELSRLIAFVPQNPVTPAELTVAEYVLLGRTPHLGYLGVEGRRDRRAVSRALARLDLGRQQQVLELVDSLRGDGLTVLSTMHDLTLAGQYADRLVLLDRGAVVAEGPPDDVLSPELLASHYGANVRVVHDEGNVFVLPQRG